MLNQTFKFSTAAQAEQAARKFALARGGEAKRLASHPLDSNQSFIVRNQVDTTLFCGGPDMIH